MKKDENIIRREDSDKDTINLSEKEKQIVTEKESETKKSIADRFAEKITEDEIMERNALDFYQILAEKCNVEAQFALGELYNRMDSEFFDQSKAAHWYSCAAAQGHKDAAYELETLENDDNGRYDAWV